MLRNLLLAAIMLSAATLPSLSQGNKAQIMRGIVVREDGTGIKAAFVLVRDFGIFSEDYVSDRWETRTEQDGSFSLMIQPGCYDIFVSANALFFPYTQRTCVQPSPSSVFKIKLKADPHPKLRLE